MPDRFPKPRTQINTAATKKSYFGEYVGPDLGACEEKWVAAVSDGNLNVICPPFNASQVLRISTLPPGAPLTEDPSIDLIGPELGGVLGKYQKGFLGRDGRIYCVPWCASRVLRIEPASDTVELIGPDFGTQAEKWRTFIEDGNSGVFFCPPWGAAQVLRIDTTCDASSPEGEADAVALLGPDFGIAGVFDEARLWRAAVQGADGTIYCPPHDASRVLCIDPVVGTAELIGPDFGALPHKWWCAVLCEGGGSAICPPLDASQVLRIDTTAGVAELVGPELGNDGAKYMAGVLAPNGSVFCPPCCADKALRIDAAASAVELVGPDFCRGGYKWSMSKLALDGNIYCPPWCARNVLRISPVSCAVEYFGPEMNFGGGKYRCSIFGEDGNLFCFPWCASAGSVLRISPHTGKLEELNPKMDHRKPGLKYAAAAISADNTLWCPPACVGKVLHIQTWAAKPKSAGKK